MIILSNTAILELTRIRVEQNLPHDIYLRVGVRGGG